MLGDRVTIGKRYGRLIVIKEIRPHVFMCECDCGGVVKTVQSQILNGHRKSCGCAAREASVPHGLRNTRTWNSWRALRQRCDLRSNIQYSDYGGRGITYCERWKLFKNFVEDMGVAPDNHTIDRIDVDGNYEPSNCRWSTPTEQAANKRGVSESDRRKFVEGDPDFADMDLF